MSYSMNIGGLFLFLGWAEIRQQAVRIGWAEFTTVGARNAIRDFRARRNIPPLIFYSEC